LGWVVNAKPQLLSPREEHGTVCLEDWVGLRTCLDRCGKSHPYPIPVPSSPWHVAIPNTLAQTIYRP